MTDYSEIKRIFGDITDHKAAEIEGSGLSAAELEKVAAVLSGDTDHGIEIGHLSPEAQDLMALLRQDEDAWDDQR
ncbi:hypothetical protein GV827_21960 [Sulfitobacter sp. JBTF-M27]|uniref:Uncharacterized protein n=1 Tax=Sulfitobacter sediminilitoris TaxID=2698830 RepID=A0A6P0CJ69_9RHOB|nr:hypothetical protein [Sulfitobacter sediminilitoris]NEK25035.1 hypothetical protein [Sulfitobacter sediminilitoris]